MKIRAVGAELCHMKRQTDRHTDRQTDRQTDRYMDGRRDMTKLVAAFRNPNAPKIWIYDG